MPGYGFEAAVAQRTDRVVYAAVGLSCLWAWVHLIVFSDNSQTLLLLSLQVPHWLVHSISIFVVLCLVVVGPKGLRLLLSMRYVPAATAMCVVLGGCFGDSSTQLLSVLGSVITSAGDGLLIVCWVTAVSFVQSRRERRLATLGGLVGSLFLYMLALRFEGVPSSVVQACLVGGSCVCLYVLRKPGNASNNPPHIVERLEKPLRSGLPISLEVALFAVPFALYYIRSSITLPLGGEVGWDAVLVYSTVLCLGVIIIEALIARRIGFSVVASAVALLTLAALACRMIAPGIPSIIVLTLVCTGFFLFLPMYYQLLCDYIARTEVDRFKVAALGPLIMVFGNFAGTMAGGVSAVLPEPSFNCTVSALGAVLVVVAWTLLLSDKGGGNLFARLSMRDMPNGLDLLTSTVSDDGEEDGSVVRQANREPRRTPILDAIDDRCTVVAERYSLTLREREVCALMVRERSLQSIADETGITLNTVKTHALHIYQKTGVHSREELFKLIENDTLLE